MVDALFGPFLRRRYVVFGLVGLTLLLLGLKFHTYHEPFDRDITWYAVNGYKMLHGGKYYTEIWDQRTPLLSANYAAVEYLFGMNALCIYVLNVLVALATLLGIFFVVERITQTARAGLFAALLWCVFGNDLGLQGNQPNTEAFMNACLVWGFYHCLRLDGDSWGGGRAIFAGLLFGLATLYKHVALAPALLILMVLAWPAGKNAQARWRAAKQASLSLGICLGLWILMGLYFLMTHRWREFTDCVFRYNVYYASHGLVASGILHNLLFSLKPQVFQFFPSASIRSVIVLLALAILSCLGIVFNGRTLDRTRWLWLAYGAGSYISIALPGRFFPHYYQLLIPPLLIGTAWAGVSLSRCAGLKRGLAVCVAAVSMAILVSEVPSYFVDASGWAVQKYGPPLLAIRDMGLRIGQILEPDETFFAWSSTPALYFWSGRFPPTVCPGIRPLMYGPMAERLNQQVLSDLRREKPELFVGQKSDIPGLSPQPVLLWIQENYRLVAGFSDKDSFILAVRRGGRLDKSLRRKPDAGL